MQARLFGQGRWLAFLIILLALGARVLEPGWVELPRQLLFDQFQRLKPRTPGEPQVAVVAIDADSLNAVGPWPWSRKALADLVIALRGAGAQVVAFDTIFPEPDRLSPEVFERAAKGLPADIANRLAGLPGNDAYFAQLLAATPTVLGLSTSEGPKPRPSAVTMRDLGDGQEDLSRYLTSFKAVAGNLPVLENAAVGRGLVSIRPDLDGTVRHFPAVVRLDGGSELYPGFAIEILRVLGGGATVVVRAEADVGVQDVVLPELRVVIPTDAKGRVYPYFAPAARDRAISAGDVIAGNFQASAIKDKIVLIATDDTRQRATPLDAAVPESETHAQLLESILSNALLSRPAWTYRAELGALAAMGLLFIGVTALVGPVWAVVAVLFAGLGLLSSAWRLFFDHRQMLDAAYPTVMVLIAAIPVFYAAHRAKAAERKAVRGLFGDLVAPSMLARATENPKALVLNGERRSVTVMTCGLRGFATASDQGDPRALTGVLSRYLPPMADIIRKAQGAADPHFGDGMLGYWNAPFDLPDHTRAACRALLKIRAATTALNTATDDSGWRVRMGLESGESCTGVIGPAHQLRYVLFGEAITSAALFERQCETYGVDNVISDRALEAVGDFAWLELDMIKMKGDAAPLRLFTLLGDEQMAADPEYLALKADFDRMLTAYRRQGWLEAAKGIALCLPRARRFDLHALLDLYVRRIENLRRDPPSANWNGVHLPAMK